MQEQTAEQRRNAPRGKVEQERERNRPTIHFQDHSFFQKEALFLSILMVKNNRKSINDYKQTISDLQKPKKERKSHLLFYSYLKEKMKANTTRCSPMSQNVFLLNHNDLKPREYPISYPVQTPTSRKTHRRFGHPNDPNINSDPTTGCPWTK